MEDIIFLDTQTVDLNLRMTAFGDQCKDLVEDFYSWCQENHLCYKDILYADMFQGSRPSKHIGKLILMKDGSVELEGTPGSKKTPYKCNIIGRASIKFLQLRRKLLDNTNS